MRLPLATVLTACALSAALLVAGRAGEEAKYTMPGPKAVLPAAQGRVLFADPLTDLSDTDGDPEPGSDLDRGADPDAVGPESVPEVPDLPDGGGLVPDGPDESDALDPSDPIFGSPADTVLG